MKQCVDPKLNNDYPPKAIAKVLCNQINIEIIRNVLITKPNSKGVLYKKRLSVEGSIAQLAYILIVCVNDQKICGLNFPTMILKNKKQKELWGTFCYLMNYIH